MTPTLKALTAAVLLASLPVAAHAMPYSQLVIFGDSLSDSGQFPDFDSPQLGGNPTGGFRFTNRTGPNYLDDKSEYYAAVSTQRLAALLGLQALPSTPVLPQFLTGNVDGSNYAVGGYHTSDVLNSITSLSDAIIPVGRPGAGTVLRSRTGYLAEFGRADANALYYLNGGGNDVLEGLITGQASAASAAASLVAGVAALQQAGARTIIVSDLPDVGLSPLGAFNNFALRAFYSGAAALYNNELDSQLAALGGNVIRLNVRDLLGEVQGDLALYGFDPSVVQTDVCFAGVGCNPDPTWSIGGLTPNPDRLMFNDGVHPTGALQQISADYIYSIISAPWEISLLPEMAMASLNGHQQQLRSEWQADRAGWQAEGQWRSFVTASGLRQEFQSGAAVSSADNDGVGLTLGTSYRLAPGLRVGMALGLQQQELESASDSEYDLRSYLLSGFAQYQQDRLWSDSSLTIGALDYHDLNRQFDLGIAQRSEQGDTDGKLYAFSTRLGYDLANAGTGWRVSPFISADLARVDVDGYREQGERSTALSYGDQQRDSRRLGLGLQANYQLSAATQVFAEVAREREFEDDPSSLDMSLNSVAGTDFELQGLTPENGQTLGMLGIGHSLGEALQVRAAYHFRGAEDRQHGVNLSLSWDL